MRAKKAPAKAKAKKVAARKPAHAKAGVHAKAKTRAKPRVAPKAAKKTPPVKKHAGNAAARPAPQVSRPIGKPSAPRPTFSPADRLPLRVVPPAGADAEDGDGAESMSLLAGPRNVQPYIPKRGEQYMNKEQLDHFRLILNTWKRDLMEEVDRTVLHMKDEAANFPDPNDRATQESEFSLELRTRDRERKLIRKIDEALKRIEDGSYGYCLETGEEIGIKRLEARPVATLCVEAQERRERRERQYGDRDDRYR
ncbi:MAG TPA: RNA polymerase-binding protein DksA [Steroidobacteraceae bacterium]|nr:RNA polymerase-binding protein DksA [Steroidobacteraceae bacterium]